MRAVSAFTTVCLGTVFLGLAMPAFAGDPYGAPVSTDSLSSLRGAPAVMGISNSAAQTNSTTQSASNTGTVSLKAQSISADVSGTNVGGNSGITTVMVNTGNQVNLSNATSVNVYMTSK